MKFRAPLAVLATIVIAGCSTTTSSSNPAPSMTSESTGPSSSASASPSSSSNCDASLWNHVYHPDRLQVIEQCKTVTGTIDHIKFEPDGDTHIDLHVADSSLINDKNIQYQHGDLVLEQICQGTVTQADAIAACQGVPHNQTIPQVGDQVTVTGTYVLDTNHGWLEVHPVTSLTVNGH